jgi:hypothetical protein
MSAPQRNGKTDEQRLVKLYMDLTGTPESTARSVFMFLSVPEDNPVAPSLDYQIICSVHDSVRTGGTNFHFGAG